MIKDVNRKEKKLKKIECQKTENMSEVGQKSVKLWKNCREKNSLKGYKKRCHNIPENHQEISENVNKCEEISKNCQNMLEKSQMLSKIGHN